MLLQSRPCLFHRLGSPDQGDHLVQDVQRLEQTFQDVRALGGLVALKTGTAHYHLVAVTHKVFDQLLQVQQARTSIHQSDVVDREAALHGRVLEQAVEHHVGHHTHLQLDDNAHTVPVALVVDKGNAFQAFVFHQLGNLLYQLPLVDHVRNLGHHYGFTPAGGYFNICFGTDHHTAASRFIGIADARGTVYDPARRKIGALDVLQQLVHGNVVRIYVGTHGIHDLTQVVGGHVGSHSHGDPAGPVQQQQGHLGRQHGGFL